MSVIVTKKDEVYLRIDADVDILYALNDIFTFLVPGAQFTPAYRHKIWDGKIRLLNLQARELYIGLLPYIKMYCERNGEEFIDRCTDESDDVTSLDAFLDTLDFYSKGKSIDIYDYQRHAIKIALTEQRALLLSPTGSGKSLILYSLVRWHEQFNRKQLIIVPTVSLVEQMYGDFKDYAANTDWDVAKNCTRIYSGKEKEDLPITISTWQSLQKLPKTYFAQYDVVYGDEAHLFQAKSLTNILTKCSNARHRTGTTGTLDGAKAHRLVLEGLFGTTSKVTTTRKLMDSKQLADLKITCLQLDYTDEEKKLTKKFKYPEEIDWLVTHPKRNRFIKNLTVAQNGNTLLLYQYVEKHGKVLYEMIKDEIGDDRKIFFIHGGVEATDRELVREITETETNAIIVASLGTFSTGINIRHLHNVIFASPSKSRIRTLQSIGRGLRLGENKESCKLYDIGDNLSWKSHKNYTLLHMVERIKIYNEEGFDYKLITVPIT